MLDKTSKILEWLSGKKLTEDIDASGELSPQKHGFRKGFEQGINSGVS